MEILLGFRELGKHFLCHAPSCVCRQVWAEGFWEGVVLKNYFLALQQWRWRASSSPRHGFQVQWGSAGRLGLLCVCHRWVQPWKRNAAAPRKTSSLWNLLVLYLEVSLKKLNKLKALKTSSKYNGLWLKHGKVCSQWQFDGWSNFAFLGCKMCSAEGPALLCRGKKSGFFIIQEEKVCLKSR